MQQIDLDKLRQNRNIFWNLIYYFNETNIPTEFVVPYKDSALFKLLPKMIELDSRQTLLENTRKYGLMYLDVFSYLRNNRFRHEDLGDIALGSQTVAALMQQRQSSLQ